MKHDRWRSPLDQEKYQEEKDVTTDILIITTTIIIIIINQHAQYWQKNSTQKDMIECVRTLQHMQGNRGIIGQKTVV